MLSYQYWPMADGGAERQAQRLAEGLAARGWRIGVVTARYPGLPRFEKLNGVDVYRIWAIPRPGKFSATFLPSLMRFLVSRGRDYTIWHAHQAFYHAAIAVSVGRWMRRLCIVKAAASGPYGDMARLRRVRMGGWVVRSLREADAIISLNAELTEELVHAGFNSSRVRRIPNGVDCTQFTIPSAGSRYHARQELGIGADELLAVFAGRLAEDKGVDFLLEAWRIIEQRFPTRPWKLILVGNELRQGEYQARLRQLRSARHFGKVSDVRPFLRAADLVVHPSLAEGLSNVVLEAMATGVPVVGTRVGGLNEQIDDRVSGLLVEPASPFALVEGLLVLLENAALRVNLGEQARSRAEQVYSLDSVISAYERLYQELHGA